MGLIIVSSWWEVHSGQMLLGSLLPSIRFLVRLWCSPRVTDQRENSLNMTLCTSVLHHTQNCILFCHCYMGQCNTTKSRMTADFAKVLFHNTNIWQFVTIYNDSFWRSDTFICLSWSKQTTVNAGEHVGKGNHMYSWDEWKLTQPLWKSTWQILKN